MPNSDVMCEECVSGRIKACGTILSAVSKEEKCCSYCLKGLHPVTRVTLELY